MWTQGEEAIYKERIYPLLEVSQNDKRLTAAFNDINLYSPEGKALSLDIDIGAGKLALR